MIKTEIKSGFWLLSLFYSAHDVFATYTSISSSAQFLDNEEFFQQSSFEVI